MITNIEEVYNAVKIIGAVKGTLPFIKYRMHGKHGFKNEEKLTSMSQLIISKLLSSENRMICTKTVS